MVSLRGLCPSACLSARVPLLSSQIIGPYPHAEDIMRNARLDEAQDGIKIAERNINNFRYADDTTLMAESEEELTASL